VSARAEHGVVACTRPKPQATVYETKSTDIASYAQHGNWVRLASPAGMSCMVCMVAACTRI